MTNLISDDSQRGEITVLDVGCNDGYLLTSLTNSGQSVHEYIGVDIAGDFVKDASTGQDDSTKLKTICGSINHLSTWKQIPYRLNTSVYIAMTHFSPPQRIKRFLLLARQRLEQNDNSRLYINYPLFDSIFSESYKPFHESGITAYEDWSHYFLYSRDEVKKLVESCGFSVEKMQTHAKQENQFKYDWDYLSLKIMEAQVSNVAE